MPLCEIKRLAIVIPVLLGVSGCMPRSDLDATASGRGTGGTRSTRQESGGNGGAAATSESRAESGGVVTSHSVQVGGASSDASGGVVVGGSFSSFGTLASEQGGNGATSAAIGSGGTLQSTSADSGLGGANFSHGGAVAAGSTNDNSAIAGATNRTSAVAGASATASTITTGVVASGGATTARGGTSASGGAKTGGSAGVAPDLGELTNAPITGKISFSSTAGWEVDGVQRESFRIETPSATYFVVKAAAAIPSLVDQNNVLWLNFSSGFRPNRGIPNLGGCCQVDPPNDSNLPTMTTVLDDNSLSTTHLRLVSKSVDGSSYWLVWDFYLTHLTITVNRSAKAYGFTYYGMPGDVLDANDELVLSTGERRRADNPYSGDLPGPVEWAYIANPETGKNGSLFLIQHGDDDLPESFSNPDSDSVRFTFGSGQIVNTPKRFSIGLINSVDPTTVTQRITYVANNIPAL